MFQRPASENLFNLKIDEETVRKKSSKLRHDKAAGADGISPRLLIEIKEEICLPMVMLFQKSIDEG